MGNEIYLGLGHDSCIYRGIGRCKIVGGTHLFGAQRLLKIWGTQLLIAQNIEGGQVTLCHTCSYVPDQLS